jgi:acetyl-CoA C-acetyltransferase
MRSAVIVSTARTPIGRAYRGAFNNLPSPTLASHAIKAAVDRAKIDGAEVDDVVFGSALQQGARDCRPACRACRSTASAHPA